VKYPPSSILAAHLVTLEDAVQRRLGANVRWESKPQSFGIILMLIPNESG
jgi:hypothetical protein